MRLARMRGDVVFRVLACFVRAVVALHLPPLRRPWKVSGAVPWWFKHVVYMQIAKLKK
jgi:hypothetical protein